MRFDQPTGHEPGPESSASRNLPYRRQPEPFRGSLAADRFDWVEPFEPLVRNKQSWFVIASLVFALSPLVVWTYSSFTASPASVRTAETTPEGPTTPGVVGPGTESSTTSESSESVPPVGPSARFGGDTSDRVTATTFTGSSSTTASTVTSTTASTTTSTVTSTTATSVTESSTSTAANRASGSDESTSPTSILEAIGAPVIEHPLTTVFEEAPDETVKRTTSTATGPCHPDYSGCVPIVIDVDCVDGDGDGPVFVEGPILVTGNDVYQIDANDDRVACFDGDAAARAANSDADPDSDDGDN